jgi:cephalosporin hydroxylase
MRVIDISGNGPLRANYRSIFKNQDVVVVHEAKAIPHIHRIVKGFNPELIIELGTSWGGVTLILHECNIEAELHSYDIECPRKPNRNLFNNNVNFHLKDILSSPLKEIIDLCSDKRRKILYCDNGNKIKEVQMYGSKLNIGDIMGIHDWDKEISYDDVKDILIDFEPMEHELFEKNEWSTRFFKKIS